MASPRPHMTFHSPLRGLLAGKKFLEARHGRRAPASGGSEVGDVRAGLSSRRLRMLLADLERDVVQQEHAGASFGREHRQNVGLRAGPK